MNKLVGLSIALGAAACSVTTSHDIDPGNLSGVVGGQVWSFQAGATDGFLSSGETDFYATLYPVAFTPCGLSEPSGPHLIVSIPKVAGDYNLDLSRNMTFVDGSDNLIAVDGRIVVDIVTATHVAGGLHGTYDIDNEVNGQFDVTVCPED
jgi:hypothetical protein